MIDSLRLALGTFTAIRVRPPALVDARTVRRSLIWAPAVAAVLGLVAALVLTAVRELTHRSAAGSTLAALAAVAVLIVLSRGLHWDGLADVADALGSRRDAAGALEIMKRSDIGPYGVLALVLVLLVQVCALAVSIDRGTGWLAIFTATVAGRAALAHACRRGIPAARPGGLGAVFAGVTTRTQAWTLTLTTAGAMAGTGWVFADRTGRSAELPALAVVAAALLGIVLVRHASRRFGGVTGDVLGAVVESATAVSLLLFALL